MATANPQMLPDFEEIRHADLGRFILISALLHVLVMIIHGLLPVGLMETRIKPPVKVKYLVPEAPKLAKKPPALVDAPQPKVPEAPRTSELVSSYDSQVHSNAGKKTGKEYQGTETLVPKVNGMQSPPQTARKERRQARPKEEAAPPEPKKQQPYPLTNKGFILPDPKQKETSAAEKQADPGVGSALALLDGFDASKYAKFDTGAKEDVADGELISLDTKETKYASYFARIKHQIERVWDYPEEAARRGISGELTLRFQIQRDGNLMDVRLMDGSGSEILDYAAIRAIKNAAPFYPFPVTIDKEKISILATFIYSPSYGAMRRPPR